MKGPGKMFEEDIKASLPPEWMCIRLQDAAGWSNAENTRFTISNVCDFIVFDGYHLYQIECKSVATGTLPIKNINLKHLDKMILNEREKINVHGSFFINFRKIEKTYIINCEDVKRLILEGKKSISIADCQKLGIEMPGEKKIKRFRYNVVFLNCPTIFLRDKISGKVEPIE